MEKINLEKLLYTGDNKIKVAYGENKIDDPIYYNILTHTSNAINDELNNKEHIIEKITEIMENDDSQILHISHIADVDGHMPVILSQYINNNVKYKYCYKSADEAIPLINIDYDNYDIIIVTDLSFTKHGLEVINRFDKDKKIFVFDHHDQAVFLNSEKNMVIIPTDVNTDRLTSGTLIYAFVIYDVCKKIFNVTTANDMLYLAFITSLIDTFYAFKDETKYIANSFYKEGYLDAYNINNMMIYDRKEFDDVLYKYMIDAIDRTSIFEHIKLISNFMRNIIEKECIASEKKYVLVTSKLPKSDKYWNIALLYQENYVSEVGNHLLNNTKAEVVFLINPTNKIVSMRSKTNGYDLINIVNIIPGSGGHPESAGFSRNTSMLNSVIYDELISIYDSNEKEYAKDKSEIVFAYDVFNIHSIEKNIFDQAINEILEYNQTLDLEIERDNLTNNEIEEVIFEIRKLLRLKYKIDPPISLPYTGITDKNYVAIDQESIDIEEEPVSETEFGKTFRNSGVATLSNFLYYLNNN